MSPDTCLLAVATVLGPVIAVALTLWRQGRFEEKQRAFQADLLNQLENQRNEFEKQLNKERAEFDQRWNRAELDRQDRLNANLRHIACAINKDYKFTNQMEPLREHNPPYPEPRKVQER